MTKKIITLTSLFLLTLNHGLTGMNQKNKPEEYRKHFFVEKNWKTEKTLKNMSQNKHAELYKHRATQLVFFSEKYREYEKKFNPQLRYLNKCGLITTGLILHKKPAHGLGFSWTFDNENNITIKNSCHISPLEEKIEKNKYSKILLRNGTQDHDCSDDCKRNLCHYLEAKYDGEDWTFLNNLKPPQSALCFSIIYEFEENKRPAEIGRLKHTRKAFWSLPGETQNNFIKLGMVQLPWTGKLYNFSENHPVLINSGVVISSAVIGLIIGRLSKKS